MNKGKSILSLIAGLGLILLIAWYFNISKDNAIDENAGEESIENSTDSLQAIPEDLIQPSDLVYQGAFSLPEGEDAKSWNYGGSAATYYPDGDKNGDDDGYPGSIYATGHEQFQYVSEISIPKPVISNDKNTNELNQAQTLQNFVDIKGNMFGELEIPRVGLEYLSENDSSMSNKLYFGWGQHLQELDDGPSHGWFDLDLSNPQIKGPWKIKDQIKYVTTDYIFAIPKVWADKYTPGKRLATGRYRDGGQGTQGPSIIAYSPWTDGNPPEEDSSLENIPLLFYSSVYDDEEGTKAMTNYHHSDTWSGATWVTTESKQAVVFAGIKGEGNCWYGYYDGTVWPQEAPFPPVGPGERGWWSDEFVGQFIFYNPSDLAKIATGEMKPHEPQPYATMNFDDLLFNIPENQIRLLGALAFDSERGILYLFEYNGDKENERSIVHVWGVK